MKRVDGLGFISPETQAEAAVNVQLRMRTAPTVVMAAPVAADPHSKAIVATSASVATAAAAFHLPSGTTMAQIVPAGSAKVMSPNVLLLQSRGKVHGSAKEWLRDFALEEGFTQPRSHLLTAPCTIRIPIKALFIITSHKCQPGHQALKLSYKLEAQASENPSHLTSRLSSFACWGPLLVPYLTHQSINLLYLYPFSSQ